jgi:hypothetical protein
MQIVDAENRVGRPAVFTLHPWELDDDPPRVRLPPATYFAHYFRLGGFLGRLRDILRATDFGPIGQVTAPGEAV